MNRNQNTGLMIGGVILAVFVISVLGFLLLRGFRGVVFGMMGPGMMGPGMMGGYGMMFLVLILFIIIFGLLIWAIWGIVAATQKSSNSPDTTDYKIESPLDILKRRYAKGEIDKDEYETKKNDIT